MAVNDLTGKLRVILTDLTGTSWYNVYINIGSWQPPFCFILRKLVAMIYF